VLLEKELVSTLFTRYNKCKRCIKLSADPAVGISSCANRIPQNVAKARPPDVFVSLKRSRNHGHKRFTEIAGVHCTCFGPEVGLLIPILLEAHDPKFNIQGWDSRPNLKQIWAWLPPLR
jgi:hypothetical protein